jgi:hypothetical protein
MLVWEVGILFGFYLDLFVWIQISIGIQIWIELEIGVSKQEQPFNPLRGLQPTNRPVSLFRPRSGPRAYRTPPRTARRAWTLTSGSRAHVAMTSSSSSSLFSPLVRWRPRAPLLHAGAPSRCGHAPAAASRPSTHPGPAAAISRPPPLLPEFPTLAASGFHPHPNHRAPEEEKKRGRRREGGVGQGGGVHTAAAEARGHPWSPWSPWSRTSTPCLPCFLYRHCLHPLTASSLPSPPPSSSGHADRRWARPQP